MGKKASLLFFIALLIISAFALFSASGPQQGVHGVILMGLGLSIVAFPPRYRPPNWLMFSGFACVLFCSMSLLPRWMASNQPWRINLEESGLITGNLITPHPEQTIQLVITFFAVVTTIISLFGHRLDRKYLVYYLTGIVASITIYAAFSLLFFKNSWEFIWDDPSNFGFFPNGNHTVTILIMGTISGLGLLTHYLSKRQWVLASCLGFCVALIIWSVLGISSSKAGILLIVIGVSIWFFGIGKINRSIKLKFSLTILGGLICILYFSSASKSTYRIKELWNYKGETAGEKVQVPGASSVQKRLYFYSDTFKMIRMGPWTGTGLGTFEYVFPQYRNKSTSNGSALHPESNWLDLAAEAGLITVIVVGCAIIYLFFYVLKLNKKSRYRNLCMSSIAAAAILPIHASFDVPAQKVGILIISFLLIAVTIRTSKREGRLNLLNRAQYRVYMIAGSLISIYGLILVRSEWLGGEPTPLFESKFKQEEVRSFYDESKNLSKITEFKEKKELIDKGLKQTEKAILKSPLDSELHYLYGALMMQLDGTDELIRKAYKIQRILDPSWSRLPLIQANSWLFTNPKEAMSLWKEALNRAYKLEQISIVYDRHKSSLWEEMLLIAKANPIILRDMYYLVLDDEYLIRQWMFVAGKSNINRRMPEILNSDILSNVKKKSLKKYWKELSDRP